MAGIRMRKGSAKSMTPEQASPGMQVRVMEHHRVAERRGLVGKVMARYGGEDYIAVDVRLADGQLRLFWPRDLEEISSSLQEAWCRLLLGRDAAG
jgi:hypothetical protein